MTGGLEAPRSLERGLRSLDGGVDVLGPGSRDLGDDFADKGVVDTVRPRRQRCARSKQKRGARTRMWLRRQSPQTCR